MRLVGILLVCLLMEVFAFGENGGRADDPRALQDYLALYVCAGEKLMKFAADSGGELADLSVGFSLVDVDIGPDDFIYVTDEDAENVQRVDPDTGQPDENAFGETDGENDYLEAPRGLAFRPDGHMLVAQVLLFVPSDVVEFDENGTYVQHLLDDPDDPVLLTIEDVACDSSGNVFVTQWEFWGDETTCVLKYTGTRWEVFGQTDDLLSPWGICFGPDGDMYVADDAPSHLGIYRYDGATGTSKGVFGQTGSSNNLVQPRYCTFGPNGDLYVTEADNSSVKVFSGPLKPDAGAYKGVFGSTAGKVPGPIGLVFGPGGTPPEEPELSIEKLETGNMVVRLTGTEGKSYELRYHSDPRVSDFTQWTFGVTIDLVGTTTGAWEDDTATTAPTRVYKAKEL